MLQYSSKQTVPRASDPAPPLIVNDPGSVDRYIGSEQLSKPATKKGLSLQLGTDSRNTEPITAANSIPRNVPQHRMRLADPGQLPGPHPSVPNKRPPPIRRVQRHLRPPPPFLPGLQDLTVQRLSCDPAGRRDPLPARRPKVGGHGAAELPGADGQQRVAVAPEPVRQQPNRGLGAVARVAAPPVLEEAVRVPDHAAHGARAVQEVAVGQGIAGHDAVGGDAGRVARTLHQAEGLGPVEHRDAAQLVDGHLEDQRGFLDVVVVQQGLVGREVRLGLGAGVGGEDALLDGTEGFELGDFYQEPADFRVVLVPHGDRADPVLVPVLVELGGDPAAQSPVH
ncbi:hypothetical protein PG993_012506 [Apiospora rasikravindrae]|uniref:Uncharacterized protein n=1 Tax=Apiospora rasikravindrae TaxID=990691 RepID=A0ABR1S422_9PEZI